MKLKHLVVAISREGKPRTSVPRQARICGATTLSTDELVPACSIAQTFPGAVPVPFSGDTDDVLGDMLALLRRGEVDALVDDDVCFIEPDPTLRVAFTVPTRNAWGGACRTGDTALVALLDGAMAAVDFRPLWERWLSALPCPFTRRGPA